MLWRVRTTLPDRPGALARLAERCGLADINILGLQIFPGVHAVTDELVLRAPESWDPGRLVGLVQEAGGTDVHVLRCTEAALADQPTRYVQAARTVVERPMAFPEVVGRLLDADGAGEHLVELTVGDVQVQLRRTTPFTATEHARRAALAALVTEVLTGTPRDVRPAADGDLTYTVAGDRVSATVDGVVVGTATLADAGADGAVPVDLEVLLAWRRRGVGTRLLLDAGRLAQERGATELVLVTGSDNPAVLPLVLAAGLRGRIRMAGDRLTVRVPVRELRPLRA